MNVYGEHLPGPGPQGKTRLLLISYFFPPLNNVASLRTLGFARYLAEAGFAVTVLTVRKNPAGEGNFPAGGGYRLVECGAPAEVGAGGAGLRAGSLRATAFGMARRVKARWLGNLVTPWDKWFWPGLKKARELMREEPFEVLLSSHGPVCCHLIAKRLKEEAPGCLWVADYRDLWSNNHFGSRPAFPFALLQRHLERGINERADLLVTVSEPLRQTLAAATATPCLVVENGYFPEDAKREGSPRGEFPRPWTFVYTGVFYQGKYDPAPFFAALRELMESGELAPELVEVRFYGPNSFLLQGPIEAARLPAGIVRLLPQVERDESLALQRRAAALLFLSHDAPESHGVLTGKLFEYMVSGRPIIACGTAETSLAGRLIAETGTGFACGSDKRLIVRALRCLLAGQAPRPDLNKISQYRRDRLVGKLAATIKEKIGEGKPFHDHANS